MELRFYCFVNYYLSSIQQGIQTGHCAVDVVRKYARAGRPSDIHPSSESMVNNWADNHKTFITLNGGNHQSLQNALEVIQMSGLPYATFNEDYQSLGGIMTCVGVVVPASIFTAKALPSSLEAPQVFEASWVADDGQIETALYDEASPQYNFIKLLKSSRLAA